MLKNKVALITGGTKGIGREIAQKMLNNGAHVFVIYSSDDSAKDGFSNSSQIHFLKGSIADKTFVKSVFSEIKNKFGKLDILVNNAGITRDNLFLMMQKSDWQDVFNVNIVGTYLMSYFAKELMQNHDETSFILNISSISGVYGRAGQINYATSKAAILGITKLFARQYAGLNINVNTLVPGLIETEMTKNLPEKIIEEIKEITLLKRLGKPTEIADVAMFLCSNEAKYITGTTINVDGGFLK